MKKMSFRFLALCLAWRSTAAWAGIAEKVDPLFSEYDSSSVPGAAVGIYQNGEILYARGYGMANLENKESVTERTNFRLASLTKQFTAMAIVQLMADGKLRADQTLSEVFPDFPAYGKGIQVRHLLGHLSGLKDYEPLIPSGQTQQVSDDDVLSILKKQTSTIFTPGARYSYSNSGYVVLSRVVKKISGQEFADFLQERIFRPLWMAGSQVYFNSGAGIKDRAYGYTASGNTFRRTDQSVTSATQGDGGVYTSIQDLFHWDMGLNGEALVFAEWIKQIFTPGKLNDGSLTGYGFGWEIGKYRGLVCQSHTGSSIGFRTAIQRYPERKMTVVVLVNRAGASPWSTARAIADRLLF